MNLKGSIENIKKYKKYLIISVIIIIIFVIIFFVINNSNSYIRALEQGNYEEALHIYESSISGNFEEREKAKNDSEKLVDVTMNKFKLGEISYEKAKSILETIEKTDMISSKIEENLELLNKINNSRIAYSKALEYLKEEDYYHAILSFNDVVEEDSNYEQAKLQSENIINQYKDKLLSEIENDEGTNYEEKISELEKLKKVTSNNAEIQAKIDIYKDKQIEGLKNRQEVSVVSANTHKEWYSDSISGITVVVKNNTDKVVKNYIVGMLAYDANGYPLKISYDGNLDLGEAKSANIQPQSTHGENTYYYISYEADKMQTVLACVKEVTYYDDSKWENPYYEIWLETHEEKPLE